MSAVIDNVIWKGVCFIFWHRKCQHKDASNKELCYWRR